MMILQKQGRGKGEENFTEERRKDNGKNLCFAATNAIIDSGKVSIAAEITM